PPADDQDALDHEADDQDAEFQDAEFQEAELHDADDHEALDHEAEDQEAEFQDALAWAALDQLAASKARPAGGCATKASSARFASGGAILTGSVEPWTSSSPTPTEPKTALGSLFAFSISWPLTMSGVQSGWSARTASAAAATMGAANEVPESWM